MKIFYFSSSDKGTTREFNEDAFLNSNHFGFFAMADGMGGFKKGDIASKVALTSILSYLELNSDVNGNFTENTIKNAIMYSNRIIFNLKETDSEINQIGTTLLVFFPTLDGGLVSHIGDSRLYILHNKSLKQITNDHSLEQNLPDFMKGIGGGKYASVLSRALGCNKEVEPEITKFLIDVNDIILMCTDGLYSMVEEADIVKILSTEKSLKSKCFSLIDKANKNGGEDNISVTLIKIDNNNALNSIEIFESE